MSHRPADAPSPPSADGLPRAARNGGGPPSAWEALFPALSPAQQQALLALATKQGFLHARQLPAANGPADRVRQFFAPLLAGQSDPLPESQPAEFEPVDKDLDDAQVAAVGRALGTPDVALIVGLPGTGKSRTVAEIVRQAARRGQRVLLVSRTPAGLDAVLARLDGDSFALPLRCLGCDENAQTLPAVSATMTFAAYSERLGPAALVQAERSAADLDAAAQQLEQGDQGLARLEELSRRRSQLEAEVADLNAVREQLPDDVRRLAEAPNAEGPFAGRLRQRFEAVRAQFDQLSANRHQAETARAKLDVDAAELADRLEELNALAVARHRWWKPSLQLVKSLTAGDLSGHVGKVREQLNAALAARDQEAAKRDAFQRDARQLEADWQAERGRLVEQESARRTAANADRMAALVRERGQIDDGWRQAVRDLGPQAPPVGGDVAAARVAARQQAERSRRAAELARRWVEELKGNSTGLPARLLESVNVVAATPVGLETDAQFAELSRGGSFNLMILDEAHLLGETELYSLAQRGERWVLVGEPVPETCAEAERAEPRPTPRGLVGRPGTATLAHSRPKIAAKIRVLPRLWQRLHCDNWRSEGGRVVCQLRPLSAADRANLERECVADCPEIELHIFAPEAGEPALAEVLFPPAMPIEKAKLFLFRELNELPVGAAITRWDDNSARWVHRLAGGPAAKSVELEPGLRELFRDQAGGWQTAAFEFDKSAWTRDQAESWVRQHLRTHDPGRTARLCVPHRMRPALANFVSAVCFEGAYALRGTPPTYSPIVEFIPVPALPNDGDGRRHTANGLPRRLPPLRGGAGQELDLSDPRHRERVPIELRPRLPDHGFINLAEAHAIVRQLETLIGGGWTSPLTVLPLYAAQAETIRFFARQSGLLAQTSVPITIEAAGAFRQRECDTAVVGLTRSHGHRAVTYGDEPGVLPLAVTRARQRLILVGDAGTLARRAAWDGPLEQYDSATAAAETAWVANLIGQLRSSALPAPVHLHEGPP